MTGRIRRPAERALHRAQIATWTAQQQSIRWMAAQLRLAPDTVHRDLRALQREWLASAAVDTALERQAALASTALQQAEAWQAFERSKAAYETTITEQREGPDGKTTRVVIQRHERDGDPAWLAAVDRAVARRCAILGLDKPAALELSGRGGGPVRIAHDDFDWDAFQQLQADAFGANSGGPAANGTR